LDIAIEKQILGYPIEWLSAEKVPGNCWIRLICGGNNGYNDKGYIYGEGAQLLKPSATQRELPGAEKIFMLSSDDPRKNILKGVTYINKYKDRPAL
jgi:hypothetical protein